MAIVTRLERKSRRWEQVWQGDSEAVANIVAGRLESDGIRTRVHGNPTPYRASALALGGTWAILVPVTRAPRARELLRENDEGRNVIADEGGAGLSDSQRATLGFAALLVAGLVTFAVVAAFLGRL